MVGVGVIGKTPQPDHTVVVHTPGPPNVQEWLMSPQGGAVLASVIVAIVLVSVFRHLPKWVVAVLVVVGLLAVGVVTLNQHLRGS